MHKYTGLRVLKIGGGILFAVSVLLLVSFMKYGIGFLAPYKLFLSNPVLLCFCTGLSWMIGHDITSHLLFRGDIDHRDTQLPVYPGRVVPEEEHERKKARIPNFYKFLIYPIFFLPMVWFLYSGAITRAHYLGYEAAPKRDGALVVLTAPSSRLISYDRRFLDGLKRGCQYDFTAYENCPARSGCGPDRTRGLLIKEVVLVTCER